MGNAQSRVELVALHERMKDWVSFVPHCLTVGSDTENNCRSGCSRDDRG